MTSLGAVGGSLFEPGSQTFEFPTLIAQGGTVVREWRVPARSASGAAYDNAYCGVFVVEDGRIATVREYLDSRYAVQVLFDRAGARRAVRRRLRDGDHLPRRSARTGRDTTAADPIRISLPGAGGAVGRRLVPMLLAGGHDIVAMIRSRDGERAVRALGATAVLADGLYRTAVMQAVRRAAPEWPFIR